MIGRVAVGVAWLVLLASGGVASAETLGDVLKAHRVTLPPGSAPDLDRVLERRQVLDDARSLVVVYVVGRGAAAEMRATKFDRRTRVWTRSRLEWREGGVAPSTCRGGLAIERFALGFLVRAHVSPSAECTIVLGHDLRVRGVLAGWPVAKLNGGRIVYQRNQFAAAPVHPLRLAMFDPLHPGAEIALYPRKPYQVLRTAHIAQMRAVYTEAWCRARNHPCDPEIFDEQLVGDVATDELGDTLVFVVRWGNPRGRPTEVAYAYAGLRTPDRVRYREMLSQDFDKRFGTITPGRALEADALRRLIDAGPNPGGG